MGVGGQGGAQNTWKTGGRGGRVVGADGVCRLTTAAIRPMYPSRTSALLMEHIEHGLGGRVDWNVLPDSYYLPAVLLQRRRRSPVALDVPAELLRPVLRVRPRDPAMLRATVPEAPVNEYRQPPTREDDVHLDSDLARPEEIVLPKPRSAAMEFRPQRLLRLRTRPTVRPHERRHCSTRRMRVVGVLW